jgi:alkylhydroperoxidase family enzyme
MARVPYLNPEDLAESDRELMDRPINLFRALANSPAALRASRGVGRWCRWGSEIDPRQRELAILAVGAIYENRYEYAHHVRIAQEFGATRQDVADVQRHLAGEPTAFAAVDRLVLDVARELTDDATLSEDRWQALADAIGLTPAVDLIVTVAYYSMVVRVLSALGVEVEDDYVGYLDDFPLPPYAKSQP